MNGIKRESGSPDKYDILFQRLDSFQSLIEEKKRLQRSIAEIATEYEERIQPLQDELAIIIKQLDATFVKLERPVTSSVAASSNSQKFSRGELAASIKELLRSNPDKSFKPKDIAEQLNTKGTTISLWFNKYGINDAEIERIPSGKEGKRYVYTIRS